MDPWFTVPAQLEALEPKVKSVADPPQCYKHDALPNPR